MITRRKFLELARFVGATAFLPSINQSCATPETNFKGAIVGGNAALGHRLRSGDFPSPAETIQTDVVIVGGGVSGLSAARYLKKYTDDFVLLELESTTGGNAVGGMNEVSAFPWGAHYLPLPGNTDPELINFLSESGVITGVRNGLPVYNEYYLCHDPKERLFIHHFWQEGLIPHEGVPKKDREQLQRFLEHMNRFREMRGVDGKTAFAIPVEFSSQDTELLDLDRITASAFLEQYDYTSEYLRWYVQYCCADDFGSSLDDTSAWAMIHYFASRKGRPANATSDAVLTWPEGNFWLINQLTSGVSNHILTGHLAYRVGIEGKHVEILCFDSNANKTKKFICDKVILATPQFINQRLLTTERILDYSKFVYAPWMVANITTNHSLTEKRGETVCWDNVIYGSEALGYVNASHQHVGQSGSRRVLTYYRPLLGTDVAAIRRQAHQRTFDDWKDIVLNDITKPHPKILSSIEEMNVWIWGHAMIRPEKDFVWSENRRNASRNIEGRIYFAHSDLSGLSIFEEAFYRGHSAAKSMLES